MEGDPRRGGHHDSRHVERGPGGPHRSAPGGDQAGAADGRCHRADLPVLRTGGYGDSRRTRRRGVGAGGTAAHPATAGDDPRAGTTTGVGVHLQARADAGGGVHGSVEKRAASASPKGSECPGGVGPRSRRGASRTAGPPLVSRRGEAESSIVSRQGRRPGPYPLREQRGRVILPPSA